MAAKNPNIIVRPATEADLDRITDINVSAMASDDCWKWRWPFREEFPEDTWNFYRGIYAVRIQQPDIHRVMLAEISSDDDTSLKTIVAASLWDLRHLKEENPDHKTPPPPTRYTTAYTGPRRDAMPSRAAAYDCIVAAAEQKHFHDSMYGKEKQLELVVLMTHKDYERRGAADKLLKWGMDLADSEGAVITLLSTRAGKGLYERRGWKMLGGVIFKEEGDDRDEPSQWAMVREGLVEVENRSDLVSEGKSQ